MVLFCIFIGSVILALDRPGVDDIEKKGIKTLQTPPERKKVDVKESGTYSFSYLLSTGALHKKGK